MSCAALGEEEFGRSGECGSTMCRSVRVKYVTEKEVGSSCTMADVDNGIERGPVYLVLLIHHVIM